MTLYACAQRVYGWSVHDKHQQYISEGISHPVFYGDLVYKLRRVISTLWLLVFTPSAIGLGLRTYFKIGGAKPSLANASFVLTSQLVPILFFSSHTPPPLFFFKDVANQLHNIICVWIANLFRTPSTADPHFFSIYLFTLLSSKVITYHPTLSMLAIEHSPRNFAFGLTLPLSSIFELNTSCNFPYFSINYSFLYLYFYNRRHPHPRPERTIDLSQSMCFSPLLHVFKE